MAVLAHKKAPFYQSLSKKMDFSFVTHTRKIFSDAAAPQVITKSPEINVRLVEKRRKEESLSKLLLLLHLTERFNVGIGMQNCFLSFSSPHIRSSHLLRPNEREKKTGRTNDERSYYYFLSSFLIKKRDQERTGGEAAH